MHRLHSWRSWNQARRAPRLGVKEWPPWVRSHGLEGRVACNGREKLSLPLWDPSQVQEGLAHGQLSENGHGGWGRLLPPLSSSCRQGDICRKSCLVKIPVLPLAPFFSPSYNLSANPFGSPSHIEAESGAFLSH